jgi:hypothetical protein
MTPLIKNFRATPLQGQYQRGANYQDGRFRVTRQPGTPGLPVRARPLLSAWSGDSITDRGSFSTGNRTRSRRSSSMRARIAKKSSAERGRIMDTSRWVSIEAKAPLDGARSLDCRSDKTISPLCSKKAGPIVRPAFSVPCTGRAKTSAVCESSGCIRCVRLPASRYGRRQEGRALRARADSYRFAWKSL